MNNINNHKYIWFFFYITKWCLISNNRIYDIRLEIWNSRFVILWSGELTPLAWGSKFWDHKIFFDISQSHAYFVMSQNQISCILISILTKSQIPFCDLSFKSIVNWHPIIFKQSKQSFSDFQNENKSTSLSDCYVFTFYCKHHSVTRSDWHKWRIQEIILIIFKMVSITT